MSGYSQNYADLAGHPAVRHGERELTYGELHRRASRLASVLERDGLSPGGRLAIMLPNRVEFVEALAASAKAECSALSVNWHLAAPELAYVLTDSGAGALVADASLREVVEAAGATCPVLYVDDDTTAGYEARLDAAATDDLPTPWPCSWPVVYTSGTTGRPKGVVHGALADPEVLRATQEALVGLWGYRSDDVHVVAGPLYHAGPQGYAALTLYTGGTVEIMGNWDAAAFLQLVEERRATTTFPTPAHFIRLLELPTEERSRYDVGSLRHVIHAGAPCPVGVKRRILKWWPHTEVWEVYGMSEGGATRVSAAEWLERPGTVGLPWPGTEVRILDPVTLEPVTPGTDGLIYVRPPRGRFHYHDDRKKTDNAWHGDAFTVGDVGHLDDDGWLYLTDRAADLVIKGGVNVYPRTIEDVLHEHPAVVDCAVFGVPDERDGEHLHAVVELRADATVEELLELCRQRLDPWSCPSSIEIVEQLPRDPNGKVLKRHLREPHWADTDRRI
ncbi:MAG: AMP-binding protein [Actinomycetota bacterium]